MSSDNATSANATGSGNGTYAVYSPPPPFPGANNDTNVTDLVEWCVVNSTVRPDGWPESPPPMPPGGWRPPYHISPPPSPPPPPYRDPPPPPPPPLPPDITLNLTYPPAPDPPIYPVWVPCNATAPAPVEPDLLLGVVDASSPLFLAGVFLLLFLSLGWCVRRRAARRAYLRSLAVPTFEGEVSRRKVLRRAKGIFEAMEEAQRRARRDEDGEYDSDDSEYMYKVLGVQKKKKKRRSMEEFLAEKARAVFEWAKIRATRLAERYLGKRRRRRRGADGEEVDASDDSDADEAEEEYASHSRDEFQKMFDLKGQSEWEERLLALMDSDGNGTVDFKEFVVGIGILGAPVSADAADADAADSPFAAFVFRLLDVSNSGRVPRDEVISVVWRYAELVESETEAELESIRAKERVRRLRAEDQDAVDVEAADVVGSRAGFESYHDQIYRRGDQTEAKALSRRRTDLEWLASWAEDEARAKIPPDPKKTKALADLDRRRRSVANVRRHARDAAQTLRREYPARVSPRDLSRFLVACPRPFAAARELYDTFKPYLAPCAAVCAAVPGLRLEELRAAHSAQMWREDQNPTWFYAKARKSDGGFSEVTAERPARRDRDAELLAELADMSRRRAAAEAAKHREFKSAGGRGDAPVAAAGLGDTSATTRVGRDGGARRERLFRGPRATGKSRSTAESARMRVDALATLPPAHAVEELGHVSERARVLALTMLPAAAAARIVHAMPPRARAEMFPKLEPEVEREVSEMLKRAPPGRAPLGTVDPNVAIETSPGMVVPGTHPPGTETSFPGMVVPGTYPPGTETAISPPDEGATFAEQERARVRRDVLDDEEVYVYTGAAGEGGGWALDGDEEGDSPV